MWGCRLKSVVQQSDWNRNVGESEHRNCEVVFCRHSHQHCRYQLSETCTASRRSLRTYPSRYQCDLRMADGQGCAVEVTRIFWGEPRAASFLHKCRDSGG